MKKYKYIAGIILGAVAAVLCSCNDLLDEKDNPYEGATRELTVRLVYPEGHPDREGGSAQVTLEDVDRGTVYTASTGNDDMARFEVAFGIYRVSARDRVSEGDAVLYFNGTRDQMIVSAASDLSQPVNVSLVASKTSQIVIKEVYCGGCKKDPLEGTYQSDKYVILYNNSEKVAYLDNICFGTVDPYNAYGTNVWLIADPATGEKSFRDYVPLVECVWGFPGGGTDYPLEPGGQAVMCINGAIDHTLQYPLSVDLNRADCFVCYDNTYYTNTTYHPTPGDKVRTDRYMQVLRKTGTAKAYTISVDAPTVLFFKVPAESGTAREYVNDAASEVLKPGYPGTRCIKVPNEWIMDGMEVFSGSSTGNAKRLAPAIDAGYVTLTENFLGRTLYRNVDAEATLAIEGNPVVYGYAYGNDPSGIDAEATLKAGGRVVYQDTNNSTQDFHERSVQSLHTGVR